MLHNALMFLATAFSDQPRIRELDSRQFFARRAKDYIEAECQIPNISVVHVLSILASSARTRHVLPLTNYLSKFHQMSGRMRSKLPYRTELIVLKLDWELTVRPGLSQVSLPAMRCLIEIGPIGRRKWLWNS